MEGEEFIAKVTHNLESTIKPSSAKELAAAHEELEINLLKDERFLPSLLHIAVEGRFIQREKSTLGTKKAAAIILRKEIDTAWKPIHHLRQVYSQSAKATVRDNIIEGICRCGNIEIAKLLGHCISRILARDYPQIWPDYERNTLTLITDASQEKVYVGLLCLYALGRIRQHFIGPDRKLIEATADMFMPAIGKIAMKLATDLQAFPNVNLQVFPVANILLKNIHAIILVCSDDSDGPTKHFYGRRAGQTADDFPYASNCSRKQSFRSSKANQSSHKHHEMGVENTKQVPFQVCAPDQSSRSLLQERLDPQLFTPYLGLPRDDP